MALTSTPWCFNETSHSERTGAWSLPEEKKVNFHFTSWGCIYAGFKCHKTLRWQALWDVIKHGYDWSAVEQGRCCLWDGLWLCQERAAKSIDLDTISVCTTNTGAPVHMSSVEAADSLSKLTHIPVKWNVYLHQLILSFSRVWIRAVRHDENLISPSW